MRISKPPGERRAELVAAARQLFDEKGVDKTRVSDIVARVGVAQGVFYYYFASKEEMVNCVVQQVAGEVDEDAQAILQDDATPYCEKVARFIELFLDVVDKFLGDEETQLFPVKNSPLARGSMGTLVARQLMGHLQVLVQQGVDIGAITAAYPWPAAQVVVYGLWALAEQKLPPRRMIYAIAEQALGLPKGELTALAGRAAPSNAGLP